MYTLMNFHKVRTSMQPHLDKTSALNFPSGPSRSPPSTLSRLLSSEIFVLSVWEVHVNVVMQYVLFCICSLSLIMFVNFIHAVTCSNSLLWAYVQVSGSVYLEMKLIGPRVQLL